MQRKCTKFFILPTKNAQKFYKNRFNLFGYDDYRPDSGVDIPTPNDITVPAHAVVKIKLGVRAVCVKCRNDKTENVLSMMFTNKECAAFWLLPRSSICKTPLMLANSVGLIDMGYRGPLIAAVRNLSDQDYTIKAGHALFQLAAADLAPSEYEVLDQNNDQQAYVFFDDKITKRGDGGFGSTGTSGSAQ